MCVNYRCHPGLIAYAIQAWQLQAVTVQFQAWMLVLQDPRYQPGWWCFQGFHFSNPAGQATLLLLCQNTAVVHAACRTGIG